jgi:hypothetical protein
MSKRLLALVTAALAAMAIATGCGSDSDGETTEAITKAAYVMKADAICVEFNEDTSAKFTAFNRRDSRATNAEQIAITKAVYLANLQKRLDKIQELPLPEEQEEKISALLAEMQKGIREATSQKAIAFNNTDGFFTKANELAGELGFKYCYEV